MLSLARRHGDDSNFEFETEATMVNRSLVAALVMAFSDGRPRSHNIDYFTLLKDDGTWKFLSASYVATAITR